MFVPGAGFGAGVVAVSVWKRMGVSGGRRAREGYVLFDDAVKPFVVESAVGGDHAAGTMLWSMLAASVDGSVEDDRVADLALVTMDQNGMLSRILQDHLHLGDILERIDALERLVRLDRDAKMLDPIFLDEVGGFG